MCRSPTPSAHRRRREVRWTRRRPRDRSRGGRQVLNAIADLLDRLALNEQAAPDLEGQEIEEPVDVAVPCGDRLEQASPVQAECIRAEAVDEEIRVGERR